jgi:hypothetical protein
MDDIENKFSDKFRMKDNKNTFKCFLITLVKTLIVIPLGLILWSMYNFVNQLL